MTFSGFYLLLRDELALRSARISSTGTETRKESVDISHSCDFCDCKRVFLVPRQTKTKWRLSSLNSSLIAMGCHQGVVHCAHSELRTPSNRVAARQSVKTAEESKEHTTHKKLVQNTSSSWLWPCRKSCQVHYSHREV